MRFTKTIVLTIIILFIANGPIAAQSLNESEAYLQKFHPAAVEQMKKYGIPASITLAQGLLESGRGTSKLATRGNNHFGIKADDRWQGDTIHSFDNGRWCIFRRYKDAAKSYEDHSKFLCDNSRYDFLFELEITDYKGWAKGLKDAYYAEDREYDKKLIGIIERYELHQYDSNSKKRTKKETKSTNEKREILKANGLLYVIAREGDTFKSLSKELGISKRKIRKYNDLYKEYTFKEGDIVYLEKKRSKATNGYNFHTTKKGDSLYKISQIYGIKVKSLYKLNPQYESYTTLKVGDVVRLR
ncbi:MAG: glucosaminidase domain-containing protein [Bacteroidaceae bacterium]|nr:glucosaminidase domain-containing protein [Bacteroidaceae bacterium]